MGQYIVFCVPDPAWEGIDYLYNLIELEPNNLKFAVIKARNMELARKKYFDDFLFPKYLCDNQAAIAQERLEHIFDDYGEVELIEHYGEIDGKTIWNMISDYETEVSPKVVKQTIPKLSEQTIQKLCFEEYQMTIAVSEIDYISK